jgi:hypothetical protein
VVENPLVAMAAELPRSIRSRLASSVMGRLSPAMISAPTANSFVHIAHVGQKKAPPFVEADNEAEPSWTMIVAEIPDDSASPATLLEQHDIADEYMKAPPPMIEVEDNKQNCKLCYAMTAPCRVLLLSASSKTSSESSKETLAEGFV